MKAVILRATMGALSGGSTGTIVVNTAIQAIKIRLNGALIINYDGLKNIDGQPSMAIATLREFYKQMYVVSMPDDSFIVEFPTALPKNSEIQIIFETASSISAIQTSGGDRDTLEASTIDILYRTGKVSAKSIIPYISYTMFSHGARTGNLDEFIPPTMKPLRKIMMITFDGTTVADDTYDSLNITEGSNQLFEGTMAYLRGIQGAKARVAQSTGHLHIPFVKGKKILSSTVKIQFRASTAGTAKFVHFAWLAYN
ncbi:MAG: hypothetical protein ACTSQJ_06100 [Promethearchaeota archaeon]